MKKYAILFILPFLINANMAQVPAIEWYYDVNDMSFGQSAVADIDGDDTLEIVFGTYRNDGKIHAINAEDGSVLWVYNTGGCMDVAPVIYDVDDDGELEVIAPGSCVAKTFCIDGITGTLEWEAITRGSDSPPTIADIDGDGKPEIIHGEFNGYVICLNGEDGSQAWEITVDPNSWIQTAPAITDLNNDGMLDFVVANWSFGTNHKIFAYRAHDQQLLWESDAPTDHIYHGTAIADLDNDGLPELSIGCYDGYVYCLNGEDGSLYWSYAYPVGSYYVGGPTSIADIDLDGHYETVFFDIGKAGALSHDGNLKWSYNHGGYHSSFRGAALSDINGDDTLDAVFGIGDGRLMALSGGSGTLLWSIDLEAHYGDTFEIDHAPIIADFDKDGTLEAFVVGGDAKYPNISTNYGRGYAISCGTGPGPDWPMFRRDIRRNAAIVPDTTSSIQEEPGIHVKIKVYPIPSAALPFIRLASPYKGKISYSIFDSKGSVLWKEEFIKSTQITDIKPALQTIAPGMYFLSIHGDGWYRSTRFIIR